MGSKVTLTTHISIVLDTLLKYQITLLLDLQREGGGLMMPKKRKLTMENDLLIENCWSKLERGEMDSDEFILEVAQGLKHGKEA